jgi:phytanoyl-CoA dioxygenase PhyH
MKMNTIFVDPTFTDSERRERLYTGQLIVYSPTASSLALVDFAREMLKEAFGSLDPETAQYHMEVGQYAEVLAALKPKFIHHQKSKECIQGILRELRFDPSLTYFDVPRMRSSTSDDYLTSGIAYAFHPHRDCWYSAPFSQINWWMPIFPISENNGMAFHPYYWDVPVRNGSRDYNYAEWNRTSRNVAAQFVKADTRKQPKPEEELDLDPQVRIVQPPGSILLFSAAQMHSSVPNTSGRTRFSIDFRTVNIEDVAHHRGAPNIDSECTGTCMGDYLRGSDLSHIPDALITEYDTPPHTLSTEAAAASSS